MDFFALRRQQLLKSLKQEHGYEATLITNDVNVFYLTGFTGGSSPLLLTAKSTLLISDSRFEQQILEESPGLAAHIRGAEQTTLEALGPVLNKCGYKNIAVEADHMTLAQKEALDSGASKVTLIPVSGLVEGLRATKDPSELEKIKLAIRLAEKSFITLVNMIREQDTERDLVNILESSLRHGGAIGSSFAPIVAFGERGALPHAPASDRKLQDHTKLLVDWGADCGYKSDLTRVLATPFGVSPTRKNKTERSSFNLEEVYAVVQKAQQAAAEVAKHGALAKDVDAAARRVFATTKLKDRSDLKLSEFYTHGTGHGIGLEIHEFPRLRPNSPDVLHAGMVITIEPGLYFPEWGGVRLEDDYLITKDGAVKLSTLPQDLYAIR